MPEARSIVAVIDEALTEGVVVTGALPPDGRDLDLLISREQELRIPGILAGYGFLPRGPAIVPVRVSTQQWVRIDDGADLAVDLNPMRRWGLPAAEERALADEAVPIAGYRHLARPSPHHTLLILARRLATGSVPADRLGKACAAVRADPAAWERARERAPAWGARRALQSLRLLQDDGSLPGRRERAAALFEVSRSAGLPAVLAKAQRKLAAARPRRPIVIGLSGLDGSGKSSQARALTSLLQQLDVAVVAEWKPLGHNSSVRVMRRAAKRLLAVTGRVGARQLELSRNPGHSLLAGADPALLRGRQNPLLTHAWATLVGLASAGHYRLVTVRQAGSGRVIVFDRFVLDTMAQLRFFYGPGRSFGGQRILIRALCPAPAAAWLLDVPAEVALARKPEQYDLPQLRQQRAMLREEAATMGVRRLDGTRPMAELRREIAAEVWRLLNR